MWIRTHGIHNVNPQTYRHCNMCVSIQFVYKKNWRSFEQPIAVCCCSSFFCKQPQQLAIQKAPIFLINKLDGDTRITVSIRRICFITLDSLHRLRFAVPFCQTIFLFSKFKTILTRFPAVFNMKRKNFHLHQNFSQFSNVSK